VGTFIFLSCTVFQKKEKESDMLLLLLLHLRAREMKKVRVKFLKDLSYDDDDDM